MSQAELYSDSSDRLHDDIYNQYVQFEPDVAHLVDAYLGHDYDTQIEHDAFLNHGAQNAVFTFEKGGRNYVVKIPLSESKEVGAEFDELGDIIEAHIRAKGITGLEQYAAASKEGVVIAEYIPGSDMVSISKDELEKVTYDQVDKYVQTLIDAHGAGIAIDPNPGNVIYDTQDGYGIIDFIPLEMGDDDYRKSPAMMLMWGAHPLEYAGLGEPMENEEVDSETKKKLAQTKLPILMMYLKAVQAHLTPEQFQEVLPAIQSSIYSLRHQADQNL